MEELLRRVEESNKHLEETQKLAAADDESADADTDEAVNLSETQTFKLNIEED